MTEPESTQEITTEEITTEAETTTEEETTQEIILESTPDGTIPFVPDHPETISTDLLFNKAKPADVFALVDMQALDPQSITLNGAAVDSKYWSINPAKDTITFTKDYLATLANGEHTFTVTTAGGSCEVVITVTGEAADTNQNNNNNNDQQDVPSGSWIWIVVAGVAVVAVVVVVVIIRKKK